MEKNCVSSSAVVTSIVCGVTSIARKKRADHRATASVKTSMRTQTSNKLRPVAFYSMARMACVRDQCLWVSWTLSRRHQHPFTGMGGGRARGKSKMFIPTASALQTSAGCKKTKRLNAFWCVRSLFFAYCKRTAFSELRSLLLFCVKNAVFSRKCDPCMHT